VGHAWRIASQRSILVAELSDALRLRGKELPMATTLHTPHRGGLGRSGPWLVAAGIVACLALVLSILAATGNLPAVSGDDDGALASTEIGPPSAYDRYLQEQIRLANDEMLFREWNDPLGWQAIPQRPAVLSSQDMLFLEQNGVYGDAALPNAVRQATDAAGQRDVSAERDAGLPTSEAAGDDATLPVDCAISVNRLCQR
jgi:hypothetical protein